MSPMKNKEIWTPREVAAWCAVSVRTVLNWIERGELKAFKLPGRGDNRIRMPDLIQFLGRHGMPIPQDVSKGGMAPRTPRILVVDDDPSAVKLIVKTLKLAGYETAAATDGFTAGAQLGSFRPDLVTLDLQMPGLPGHQVIELIRGSKVYRGMKILVVSSLSAAELDRARKLGADDTLQKPIEYKVLQARVAALLAAESVRVGSGMGDVQ
jgi:two-component system, OmpR family, response regulator VicR